MISLRCNEAKSVKCCRYSGKMRVCPLCLFCEDGIGSNLLSVVWAMDES